jgi:hypothetical protein
MSFLKKLGGVLSKGLQLVGLFGPVVKLTVPGSDQVVDVVSKDLAQVAEVIANTEAFGQALGMAGSDKLKAAVGPVAQIILGSSLLAGRKIENEDLFKQGAKKIADGMADVLNSLHEDGVKTVSKT